MSPDHPVAEVPETPGEDSPTGGGSTESPDYFEPGRSYTTNDGYTAPEDVLRFRCAHTTTTPSGARIAFGFARVGTATEWTPTGLGDRDWAHPHGWHVISPGGEVW